MNKLQKMGGLAALVALGVVGILTLIPAFIPAFFGLGGYDCVVRMGGDCHVAQ